MRLSRLFAIPALAFLALGLFAEPAFAKKVSVEWKEIKGAADYEIQIQKGEKTVLQRKINDTSWAGPLDFGVYAYQIRAYDKVNRPGAWSSPKPLVVMPSPPELVSPDGGKMVFYGAESKATFKWKPVQGASRYVLTVKNEDQNVFEDKVEGTEKEITHLKPGAYKWQVVAVVEAGGRTPASFAGKKWESKPSDTNSFKMIQDKLEAPTLVSPKGDMRPPPNGKLDFKWKPVAGAEAYEIKLIPIDKDGRAPANAEISNETTLTTQGTNLTTTVSGEGRYRWQVRALAAIEESKPPEAVGPVSETEFNLNRNADFLAGSGYVALSTMIAPYAYDLKVTGAPEQAPSSVAATVRGSGEYWITPQLGVAASFEHTIYEIDNQTYGRNDKELDFKYRVNVTRDKYAWFFSPKIGVLQRDATIVVPQGVNPDGSVSVQNLNVTTVGPTIGFDLRKQLSDRFSLGVKFAYYYPIAFSSPDGLEMQKGAAADGDNTRNMGFGAQALYWLGKRWGVGAGVYVEKRSIAAFKPSDPGQNDGGTANLKMDGSYFFTSLIYSFGL